MPLVPVPNQPFELSVRLDNLGQTEATSLTMNLERWTDEGWLSVESASIGRVNGGSSSSGYATAFPRPSEHGRRPSVPGLAQRERR